ncbi:hypothetical protein [Leptospira noguchii]|uniref:hypothetical protein n=1 Tax=Leptospira noguchii TaxID=28182 RepID=UPI000567D822|nr:hypothetical protein [Leptospira noguchii]
MKISIQDSNAFRLLIVIISILLLIIDVVDDSDYLILNLVLSIKQILDRNTFNLLEENITGPLACLTYSTLCLVIAILLMKVKEKYFDKLKKTE